MQAACAGNCGTPAMGFLMPPVVLRPATVWRWLMCGLWWSPALFAADLPDGTALALRWGAARGCYGGQPGRALLLAYPVCSRSARVPWRSPGCDWGCC